MPARDQTSSLLARQHIQYEDPFAKFAQYANQKGAQIRADERYADEQARQKVLDDRAATLFGQQQEDRAKEKARRAAMEENVQIASLIRPEDVKNAVAFQDPRYKEALADYVKGKGTVVDGTFVPTQKDGSAVDITNSAEILSQYLQKQAGTDQSPTQTAGSVLPAINNRIAATGGSIGSNGGGSVISPTVPTGGNPVYNKEGFVNPEAVVEFGVLKKGNKSGTKPLPKTTYSGPFKERSQTDGNGDVIQMKTNERGSRYPSISIGNAANKLGDIMPMTSSIISEVGNKTFNTPTNKPYETVLKNPSEYTPEAIREAVMNTPGLYKNPPASSVRVPNEKGQALLDKYKPTGTPDTMTKRSAKVSDIDLGTMYNQDGSKIDASKKETSKTGNVFFKTPNGMVNALTLGKVMQDNYNPAGSVVVSTTPIKNKVVHSKTSDIAQGAPVFKTSKAFVESVAKTNGIPVERVTGTMNQVGDMYKNVLAMMGQDNKAERDELTSMLQAHASQNGLLPTDYDVSKTVNSVLPANDLTQRQIQTMNVVLKQIDDFRQDQRWAKEDQWKAMEMAFREKQFAWTKMMDGAGLNLKKQELALKQKEAVTPKQELSNLLVQNPETGVSRFMPKNAELPKGFKIVDQSPNADDSKPFDIKGLGNQKKVSNWISNAKSRGFTDREINRALNNAPTGDDTIDFGNPDLDLSYANNYLQQLR